MTTPSFVVDFRGRPSVIVQAESIPAAREIAGDGVRRVRLATIADLHHYVAGSLLAIKS